MDTAQRIAATRSRLRELQLDEHRVRSMGPPCVECRHYIPPVPSRFNPKLASCGHIAASNRRYDVTVGKFDQEPELTTDAARADDGLCGPEAIMFDRNLWPVRLERLKAAAILGPAVWAAGYLAWAFIH